MAACFRLRVVVVPNSFLTIQRKSLSQKSALKNAKKYSASVILPSTKFPLRHDHAKRTESDRFIYENCGFSSLYSWQREHINGVEFILHDGPPYANGSPHMGHAINKILKDITIRHKLLQGFKVHYVPGWDCHGLPIEHKALKDASSLSDVQIREKAREFAKEAIRNQRNVFRSWGVMADWDECCYYTFDKEYIKNQLHQFHELFERQLVYRDVKPVFWSPSARTALAEAELEYNPNHRSTATTVRLHVATIPLLPDSGSVFALIWTTTPWTLPANQAVCFNPESSYSLVQIDHSNERYIVATELVESLQSQLNKKIDVVLSFAGSSLSGATYHHPVMPEQLLPFLPGDHVTLDKGTGLVHTAPAHGPDDFVVALRNNLKVECIVNEDGCYTELTIPRLRGLPVLGEGNAAVLELLEEDILHTQPYIHNYPYDWRTKKPVIIRASRQWFLDTAAIKQRAIAVLGDVSIYPDRSSGSSGLAAQLERRPYWCISRQRVWGVPIPVLYRQPSLEPIITPEAVQHYCNLMDKHGTDFWWTLPIEELVTEEFLEKNKVCLEDLTRGNDILDIWFDSGMSWSSVLGPDGVADLYLEGVDQFTGWFQSSLMTSVALRDIAPYKAVFVHGFAVDEKGKKMSKSEGNVVDPVQITNGGGGRGAKKSPAYGVDTLRWWVASHATQHSMVTVSQPIIQSSSEAVHKIRIVLRFLLGVMPHSASQLFSSSTPRLLDQYLLHLLFHFHHQVASAFDTYQFNRVATLITNFVTNDVSALYCHLVKDRLYCSDVDDPTRKDCQTVARHILETVVRAIGPILPHLAEEVYFHHPCKNDNEETLFRSRVYKPKEDWNRPDICETMDSVLHVKRTLNKSAAATNTFALDATIHAGGKLLKILKSLHNEVTGIDSELTELLQVSSVFLIDNNNEDNIIIQTSPTRRWLCDRCRRYAADTKDEPCIRCQNVLSNTH